jgi:aminoglycoside 6'-N-acetyltransferase I
MRIEQGTVKDVEPWAHLRATLWPTHSVEDHRNKLMHSLSTANSNLIGFVALSNSGEIIGFAEAALRNDYVNGCETSPVAFLDGIYVQPEHRRKGVARLLCDAVGLWGKSVGCTEFASDALLDNKASHTFHAAIGFKETERVVFFRKHL